MLKPLTSLRVSACHYSFWNAVDIKEREEGGGGGGGSDLNIVAKKNP